MRIYEDDQEDAGAGDMDPQAQADSGNGVAVLALLGAVAAIGVAMAYGRRRDEGDPEVADYVDRNHARFQALRPPRTSPFDHALDRTYWLQEKLGLPRDVAFRVAMATTPRAEDDRINILASAWEGAPRERDEREIRLTKVTLPREDKPPARAIPNTLPSVAVAKAAPPAAREVLAPSKGMDLSVTDYLNRAHARK